jgi:hypothetical protein
MPQQLDEVGVRKRTGRSIILPRSVGGFVTDVDPPQAGCGGRAPVDTDRRVRRLFRTGLGDKAADATQRAIASIEARWRQEIGPEPYDAMKQALRKLGHESLKP